MTKCTQCGHQNDQTRVFCQNCGTRLERAAGDAPKISGPTIVPTGPARRRKSGGGLGGALVWLLRRLISTAILAALAAVFVQMAREPADVPPATPANEAQATQLYQFISTYSVAPYPRSLDLKQAQINNYLAARILPAAAAEGGSSVRAQFQRAFVMIGEGNVDFYIEQKFFGWPVFMYLTAVPELSGGELSFKVVGSGVGHMPIHPALTPLVQRVIEPVISSVSDAKGVLKNLSGLAFVPGVAKLSWAGAKPQGN